MIKMSRKMKMLKEEFGDKYCICIIDFEPCLYRDFGNGFNVEVSGCNTNKRNAKANLYLWFGTNSPNCIMVKSVYGIEMTANAIDKAAEELYTYSQSLLEQGYNNRNKIFNMIWNDKENENE